MNASRLFPRSFWVFLLVLGLLGPGVAGAAERIRLVAIDGYAPTTSWGRVFYSYFIPEIDRRLAAAGDYEIEWIMAFSGTVAKPGGVLEALQHGIADIGIVTTPHHGDKIPFFNLSFVTPFVTADVELVARTASDLVERYPILKDQFKAYNQVYLTTLGTVDTYQTIMVEPIRKLSDYRGRKIAGIGMNLRYIDGVGATGVSSNLGEFFNALSTGVVDGVVLWAEAALKLKFYQIAPYFIDARIGAIHSKVVTVNARTWKRLPAPVKAVLLEAAVDYRDVLAREVNQAGIRSKELFAQRGGSIYSLSEAQRTEWANGMDNLAQEWAEDLERRGLPGRILLKEYMDVMRAENQPIVRHWDRE